MYEATVLQEKAQMFEQRAENAIEPISKQHFKEMAAHYRSLAVEHLAFKHDERVLAAGLSLATRESPP